jgi:3-oxoadipate enol-lactonase
MTGVTIAGETFNVLFEGDESKPVLMLSNPIATNLHIWDPQCPALLEHFRLLRYDSRGHGLTTVDHGPYSIGRLGRDALAIMDALGVEKAHWLGLSLGGMTGLWLLINARERIDRAVLAGTAAHVAGADMWNNRIRMAREGGMEGVAEGSAERWFTRNFREREPGKVERVMAMVRATPLEGYVATCAAVRDMDLREAVRGITNKVLLIAGRHDSSTPPGMGALIASAIKGAELVTLEASHLSNIEDEADFTKGVIDFLTAPEAVARKAPPRRRAAAKKAVAARKAPARKAATRKVPAKKAAAKKTAKKGSVKKGASKRAGTKKVTLKKATVKKPAKKSAAAKRRGAAKKRAGRRKR